MSGGKSDRVCLLTVYRQLTDGVLSVTNLSAVGDENRFSLLLCVTVEQMDVTGRGSNWVCCFRFIHNKKEVVVLSVRFTR